MSSDQTERELREACRMWATGGGTHREIFGPLLASRDAAISERDRRIAELQERFGRLVGVVRIYVDADPQVRGEAYRDLTATLEWLDGATDDALYGWPAAWARQRDRIAELEREVNRLENKKCGHTLARESVEQHLRDNP